MIKEENRIKNEDMIKFENETGKKALWNGKITRSYLRWLKGEKIYYRNKNQIRVSLYISKSEKIYWTKFIKGVKEVKGFSDLIRSSVNERIECKLEGSKDRNHYNFQQINHALKEPLANIKGYAQFVLKQYGNELNDYILANITRIVNSCDILNKEINKICGNEMKINQDYDLLIVDDNIQTIGLLKEYFQLQGYESKCVLRGAEIIEELSINEPKVILLDVILSDSNGIELCKLIRSNPEHDQIKIYLITALSPNILEKKLEDIRIDGFIFKPFNLSDLDPVLNNLRDLK